MDSKPNVSIDVVPVRYVRETQTIEFGLSKRIFEPFLGAYALPGVLLGAGESVTAGALRALESKAGLPAGQLLQSGVFDGTNRDPRGATISIALLSIQDSTVASEKVQWHSTVGELPFDHASIVEASLVRLKQALWNDVAVTRALLGERFTTADAVAVGVPIPNVSNVKRWLNSTPYLKDTGETFVAGKGRPATLWTWND